MEKVSYTQEGHDNKHFCKEVLQKTADHFRNSLYVFSFA